MNLDTSNYNAWLINEKDYPVTGNITEQIQFLIGYGILAPSIHNTQPWKFKISGNILYISSDKKMVLPCADEEGRHLQISLGCCATNIMIAATHYGLRTECSWSAGTGRLTFEVQESSLTKRDLFEAITNRYSDKMPYQTLPLKTADQKALRNVKTTSNNILTLITDRNQMTAIMKLHQAATLASSANSNFFKELGLWLRPSNTTADDGMPGFVIGLTDEQSRIFLGQIHKLAVSAEFMAEKDAISIMSSSAVGIISSKNDDPENWFNSGRYYESIALQATASGLVMSPMAAMINSPLQRQELAPMLTISKDNPQIFFRIGYSRHKPYHTPRRNKVIQSRYENTTAIGTNHRHKAGS